MCIWGQLALVIWATPLKTNEFPLEKNAGTVQGTGTCTTCAATTSSGGLCSLCGFVWLFFLIKKRDFQEILPETSQKSSEPPEDSRFLMDRSFPDVFYFFASWFKLWKFFFPFLWAWWFSSTILAESGVHWNFTGSIESYGEGHRTRRVFSSNHRFSELPPSCHKDLADPMAWPWLRKSCTSKFMIPSSKIWKILVWPLCWLENDPRSGETLLKDSSSKLIGGASTNCQTGPSCVDHLKCTSAGSTVPKNDGCNKASKDRISWGDFHPFLWMTCRLGALDTEIIWNNVSLVVSAKSPEINMVWLTSAFFWISPWEIYHWLDVIKAVNLRHFFIRTQGTLCTTAWLCFGFQKGNATCLVWFDGGHFRMFFFVNWWQSGKLVYVLYPHVLHICGFLYINLLGYLLYVDSWVCFFACLSIYLIYIYMYTCI